MSSHACIDLLVVINSFDYPLRDAGMLSLTKALTGRLYTKIYKYGRVSALKFV